MLLGNEYLLMDTSTLEKLEVFLEHCQCKLHMLPRPGYEAIRTHYTLICLQTWL